MGPDAPPGTKIRRPIRELGQRASLGFHVWLFNDYDYDYAWLIIMTYIKACDCNGLLSWAQKPQEASLFTCCLSRQNKTLLLYNCIFAFFLPNACISSSGSNPLDFSICRPPLFEEDGHIAGVCTCQDCEIKSYAVTNVHIHCVLSSQVDG